MKRYFALVLLFSLCLCACTQKESTIEEAPDLPMIEETLPSPLQAFTGVYQQIAEGESQLLCIDIAGDGLLLQRALYGEEGELYSIWMQELAPNSIEDNSIAGTAATFWIPFVQGDIPSLVVLSRSGEGLTLEEVPFTLDGGRGERTEFLPTDKENPFHASFDTMKGMLSATAMDNALVGTWTYTRETINYYLAFYDDGSFTCAQKEQDEPVHLSKGAWSAKDGALELACDTIGDDAAAELAVVEYQTEGEGLRIEGALFVRS